MPVAVAVFRDVAVDQPDLLALHRRIAFGDRALAVAKRLHLGPGQRDARLEPVLDEIIEARAPVLGDDLLLVERGREEAWTPRLHGTQIRPACSNAASTARFDASDGSVKGKRSSAGKPGRTRDQRIFGRPRRCVARTERREADRAGPGAPALRPSGPRASPPGNREQSRGATLAVTEMQPTPPIALKPSAMSSLPDSWTKVLAAGEPLGGDPGEIAGRILDPDDRRDASATSARVSTEMSATVRDGTL